MTQLRINLKGFKRVCENVRESGSFDFDWSMATTLTERKDVYRDHCEFYVSWFRPEVAPVAATRADHLAALSTAARAAYLDGATRDQVERLADLFAKAGEFSTYSGGRLTKAEASRLISSF